MAQWMNSFGSLEGMTPEQVAQKLGPPLPVSEFPSKPFAYYLDSQQHGVLGVKWAWLVVTVGPSGTVVGTEIVWRRD